MAMMEQAMIGHMSQPPAFTSSSTLGCPPAGMTADQMETWDAASFTLRSIGG
jgi:hypothetical protein